MLHKVMEAEVPSFLRRRWVGGYPYETLNA